MVKIIYWYEHGPKTKNKNWFWKRFGKTMEMWENIDILHFSQQKEEEIIWCQKQIIIPHGFFLENLLAIEMKVLKYT